MMIQPVVDTFQQMGLSGEARRAHGLIELIGVILYIIRARRCWAPVLLTGLLGGAIATHVRIDSPCSVTRSSAFAWD